MADRIGIHSSGAVGRRWDARKELRRQKRARTARLEQSFLALTAQEANFTEEKAAAH